MREQMKVFVEQLTPGATIVDLGAGVGTVASSMVDAGLRVIAVDRNEPSIRREGIEWHVADIEDWLRETKVQVDAIMMHNVLQFMPAHKVREDIFPEIRRCLRPGGVISLIAFSQAPTPAFTHPHKSYWTVDCLKELCDGMRFVHEWQGERLQNDLNGSPRKFRLSEIVAK